MGKRRVLQSFLKVIIFKIAKIKSSNIWITFEYKFVTKNFKNISRSGLTDWVE